MKDDILERDGNFASDLKRLRTQQQEMSGQDLADKLGCTPQCILEYESGARRPQLMTVDQINQALVGRDRFGPVAPASQSGHETVFVRLEDLPDDVLAGEWQRRRRTETISE